MVGICAIKCTAIDTEQTYYGYKLWLICNRWLIHVRRPSLRYVIPLSILPFSNVADVARVPDVTSRRWMGGDRHCH